MDSFCKHVVIPFTYFVSQADHFFIYLPCKVDPHCKKYFEASLGFCYSVGPGLKRLPFKHHPRSPMLQTESVCRQCYGPITGS